jgi:CarD family transcriptional regulator
MDAAFDVGDKAVYPVHGVAEIVDIEKRDMGGTRRSVYVVKILETGLKIMIPCDNAAAVGLRTIISAREVKDVFAILRAKNVAPETQTWNRRYRDYMNKIKTGSCYEIAEVLRDLGRLRSHKELSFGERRMYETVHSLLVKELALARATSESTIAKELDRIFCAAA